MLGPFRGCIWHQKVVGSSSMLVAHVAVCHAILRTPYVLLPIVCLILAILCMTSEAQLRTTSWGLVGHSLGVQPALFD